MVGLGRGSVDWHVLAPAEVMRRLETDPLRGISEAEAAARLAAQGENHLPERGRRNALSILFDQARSVMVWVLVGAALISLLLGETLDAAAIVAIVVLNLALGFVQEFRAEHALQALARLAAPVVRIRREGTEKTISARSLVAGDIVVLEPGNLVPADGRVLSSASLRVQESALTGESHPVDKVADAVVEASAPLGDRTTMAFMGTLVTQGRGVMAVTGTGLATELGRIARTVAGVGREPTPLQRRLEHVARILSVVALGIVAVVFALGAWRGADLHVAFLTAVSLAVAAIPEGLLAVVTIALALGAQRMLHRRALVRRLVAVETLGRVTVICTDKTGTITENRMTVTEVWCPGTGAVPVAAPVPAARLALLIGALCNDAVLEVGAEAVRAVGDPTEAAIVEAAAGVGLDKKELERVLPRIDEVAFSSERKRMATVHERVGDAKGLVGEAASLGVRDGDRVLLVKGALQAVRDVAHSVWRAGAAVPLDPAADQALAEAERRMASDGLRVLAVAFRVLEAGLTAEAAEAQVTLVGLLGFHDPPRPEAAASVAACHAAGIRPILITGDHAGTAVSIARRVGIRAENGVLTGPEVAALSPQELAARAARVDVYARVDPVHKLAIVAALQGQGHIVAMTGDGVNDAPALRRANVGVAMGQSGTDVAKQSADIVLIDDNFSTIVAAVEQGRIVQGNIRKFLKYMFTTNTAEVALMVSAPLLGMPLPLLPLQILWINLVTDGLPALALALEPAERDTMRRPPVSESSGIFGDGLGRHVVWVGLLMSFLVLLLGYLAWRSGVTYWQTLVFTGLMALQLAHVVVIRGGRASLLRSPPWANPALALAVLGMLLLQLVVIYEPHTASVFDTTPLPAMAWAWIGAACIVLAIAVELEKRVRGEQR